MLLRTHEQILPPVPPYQTGAFGNYYLPTNSPLYNAGSRSYAEAGLAHYTTRLDQVKEMDETSDMVNIGLHYIATTGPSSAQPRDTDGDGIPDYIEDADGNGQWNEGVETRIDAANTESGVHDSLNIVYDDVDLDGDGMVGRIEKALSRNPLLWDNPLTLTKVTTGEEPDIATFKVPISYSLVGHDLANRIGKLNLLMDGKALSVACEPDINGVCALAWDTTFSPPGFHVLQVEFVLNQKLSAGPYPDPPVIIAMGPPTTLTTCNVLEFDPFYCQYDDLHGAILYARIHACPDATYTIVLQTPEGVYIKTITGSTSSGEIETSWDLTYDDGTTLYTGDSVNAIFNITLPDQRSYSQKLNLTKIIDLNDLYLPVDGNFTVAYTTDHSADEEDLHDCIQLAVVDQLLGVCNAIVCYDHFYDSTFNTWSDFGAFPGNPGHLATQADSDALMYNLANENLFQAPTKNFYFFGHASINNLGTMEGDDSVHFYAWELAARLGNTSFAYGKRAGKWRTGQAYRLVFLDGCCTAMDPEWAHSFGVYDRITSQQLANCPKKVQAYVGWTGMKKAPGRGFKFDMANCYIVFWAAWQSGLPLDRCIWYASQDHPPAPVDFIDLSDYNFGPKYQYWSVPAMKRRGMTYQLGSPRIRIYGYAGITRTGYQPGYDDSVFYR